MIGPHRRVSTTRLIAALLAALLSAKATTPSIADVPKSCASGAYSFIPDQPPVPDRYPGSIRLIYYPLPSTILGASPLRIPIGTDAIYALQVRTKTFVGVEAFFEQCSTLGIVSCQVRSRTELSKANPTASEIVRLYEDQNSRFGYTHLPPSGDRGQRPATILMTGWNMRLHRWGLVDEEMLMALVQQKTEAGKHEYFRHDLTIWNFQECSDTSLEDLLAQ